jgi:hypothetical protein
MNLLNFAIFRNFAQATGARGGLFAQAGNIDLLSDGWHTAMLIC